MATAAAVNEVFWIKLLLLRFFIDNCVIGSNLFQSMKNNEKRGTLKACYLSVRAQSRT